MPKYSGPALAAGAISKAIGEMLEGVLAGHRGGLAAERQLSEMGVAERDQALRAAAFPLEADLARAQTARLRAEVPKLTAETERLYMLMPEEAKLTRAEADRTTAQAGVYRGEAGALEQENQLLQAAADDLAAVRDNALKQGRSVTTEERRAWLSRHPLLLAGAGRIPVSDLLMMSEEELLLRLRSGMDPYKGPELMLRLEKQAEDAANDDVANLLKEGSLKGGLFSGRDVGMAAMETKRWLAIAYRNRLLRGTGMPGGEALYVSPGAAPPALREYVLSRLQETFPDMSREDLLILTHQVLAFVAAGGSTLNAAIDNLKSAGQSPTEYDPNTGELK